MEKSLTRLKGEFLRLKMEEFSKLHHSSKVAIGNIRFRFWREALLILKEISMEVERIKKENGSMSCCIDFKKYNIIETDVPNEINFQVSLNQESKKNIVLVSGDLIACTVAFRDMDFEPSCPITALMDELKNFFLSLEFKEISWSSI